MLFIVNPLIFWMQIVWLVLMWRSLSILRLVSKSLRLIQYVELLLWSKWLAIILLISEEVNELIAYIRLMHPHFCPVFNPTVEERFSIYLPSPHWGRYQNQDR